MTGRLMASRRAARGEEGGEEENTHGKWKEIFPTSLARNVVGGHNNTLRSALAASETLICSVHYSNRLIGGGRMAACIHMCVQTA